ncbi:MAG: DegT/DnrJ/EryC1/StrS family aminotransferase [Candidatus Eremiobacteraeota bacterium]|nr:DegT/DnrJ/EryC1/StrS family aminotransferase [Candidatus Eremiobacteraeota bacterium]
MRLPSDQDATGRDLGDEELALLERAVRSGTLTSTKGSFVPTLEKRFAQLLGMKYAYACASGTGAIHTAIAALNPEPGEEIITSPITDMGALAPILYQGAIPVFADVDPKTACITAQTIAACLSRRTRAIVVTHLFGHPCDMGPILQLARENEIPVIEDCAQAFLTRSQGRFAGTFGRIACFSMQQGKHMTSGEGGIVATNDPLLARRMYLFINKAWGYGDPDPDHYFLALNYRMSELQGAVALAQLDKLEEAVKRRIEAADAIGEYLDGVEGIDIPSVRSGDVHSYWKYAIHVDGSKIPGGAVALANALRPLGVFTVPRYIQKPAFMCEVFQRQSTFGSSRYPFTLARPQAVDYDRELFPGTFAALDSILVVPINERYTTEHAAYVGRSIAECAQRLAQA